MSSTLALSSLVSSPVISNSSSPAPLTTSASLPSNTASSSSSSSSRPAASEYSFAYLNEYGVPRSLAARTVYPKKGQEAIAFARALLALPENHGLREHIFLVYSAGPPGPATLQPLNREIALLTTLLHKEYIAYKRIQSAEGSRTEGESRADRLMKLAYALHSLALEDLPGFVASRKHEYQKEKAAGKWVLEPHIATYIGSCDCYHGATLFFCPFIYREIQPTESTASSSDTEMHEGWRTLYNDSCSRIDSYISKEYIKSYNGESVWKYLQPHERSTTLHTTSAIFCKGMSSSLHQCTRILSGMRLEGETWTNCSLNECIH